MRAVHGGLKLFEVRSIGGVDSKMREYMPFNFELYFTQGGTYEGGQTG